MMLRTLTESARDCYVRMACILGALALPQFAWSHGRAVENDLARTAVTVEQQAKRWGISTNEYALYIELMRGARGTWTPQADPLMALGAHAVSDDDRRRFAELYVLQESRRVEGELAFQRAVSSAWKRLFPNQNRLQRPQSVSHNLDVLSRKGIAETPIRYAVVTGIDCSDCEPTVRRYVESLAGDPAFAPVDLYVRGTDDLDEALRTWVDGQRIPLTLMQSNRLTVNHGDQYAGEIPQIWSLSASGPWRLLK